MKPLKIDHIGIAVTSIDEAIGLYLDGLGIEEVEREEVPSQKVNIASLRVGESTIELVEANDPQSPIARFIEKKGPGIHHLALEVEDIESALERLKEKGYRLVNETPRPGAGGKKIAFIHPKATSGVLLELCQSGNRKQ